MKLFVGYIGYDDDKMLPITVGNDYNQCFSDTLMRITEMGMIQHSQMGVQDKGEIGEDEYAKYSKAFSEAHKAAMIKHKANPQ